MSKNTTNIDHRWEASRNLFLSNTRKWITKEFGSKCPDFEPICPNCRMWTIYNQLEIELEHDTRMDEIFK